jgi:sulfatase modifying factor 1
MMSSESFDPYHKWLGIPVRGQPPSRYRLLRIDRFESDPEVIENAYDKEMADLKAQEHGQHAELVDQLSREIIEARDCLLNAEKKGAYDAELYEQLKAEEDGDELVDELAQRIAIDEAVRAATVGLINERNRLRILTAQTSARQRQALIEVRRLRSEIEQLDVEGDHTRARLNVLAPLHAVDQLLAKLSGDGNVLLHQFLRVVAVVLPIVFLVGATWLAMSGSRRQSESVITNESPELAALTDRTIIAGDELTMIVRATDADDEDSVLRFSLSAEPTGASIDATTGQFRWTPTDAHGGQEHRITLRVEDDATPPGNDEKSFMVTVTDSNVGTTAGQERDDNGLKMKLRRCPTGKFTMGSPTDEPRRRSAEDQVAVELASGFWLGKHEVTQDQWVQVMGTKPWTGETYVKEGTDYPATYVSWDDTMEFCRKLTDQERRAGRLAADWQYTLPTEAQWEYACRAGSTTRFSFGDDGSQLGEFAWFSKNALDVPERYAHQIGEKKPNTWGLHDMHGNVREWCRDLYESKLPGGTNPEVTSGGSLRVFRGGGWRGTPQFCRSAIRSRLSPGYRVSDLGFRVAAVPCSQSARKQ